MHLEVRLLELRGSLFAGKNQLLHVRPICKVGNAYLELKLLGPQYHS